MKIVRISVYQTFLPLVDGSYAWADGKSVSEYDSTVVIIITDTGLSGAEFKYVTGIVVSWIKNLSLTNAPLKNPLRLSLPLESLLEPFQSQKLIPIPMDYLPSWLILLLTISISLFLCYHS